eukprot:155079-Hanusia_phi.AAC.2
MELKGREAEVGGKGSNLYSCVHPGQPVDRQSCLREWVERKGNVRQGGSGGGRREREELFG